MNNTSNTSSIYICKFCNQPIDSSEIRAIQLSATLGCDNHPELFSLQYTFLFHTPLKPSLLSIDLFFTNTLKLTYQPFDSSVKYISSDFPESLKLMELFQEPFHRWRQVTQLPVELLNKPIPDIVKKVNSLKAFF